MGQEPATKPTEAKMETVRDLMSTWLAWQLSQPALGQRRKDGSKRECSHVCEHMGDVLIARVDTTTLSDYQRARLREGAATGTVKNEVGTMIQAWNWGGDRGLAPARRLRA